MFIPELKRIKQYLSGLIDNPLHNEAYFLNKTAKTKFYQI